MAESQLTDSDVIQEALNVINEAFVGLFSTCDASGVPYSRVMGAAPVSEGLRKLYTLSGKQTRKLEHLAHQPEICWLFNSAHYAEVVTLHGQARVLDSPVVAQPVWDRLAECAQAYSMNALSNEDNLEFVVVETTVETIEFICPRMGIVQPQTVTLD